MKCAYCGRDATERPDKMYAQCWFCYSESRYKEGKARGNVVGFSIAIAIVLLVFAVTVVF